jgi:hypothetical protein
MSSDSDQLALSVSESSVSLLPETGEQHDVGRTGRQRKAPTIFEDFIDEKSIAQEIKTYSSYSKKAVVKKRLPVDNIASAYAKKPRGSQGTLPKKTKLQPVVVLKEPSLSIKDKEQLQIREVTERALICRDRTRTTIRGAIFSPKLPRFLVI